MNNSNELRNKAIKVMYLIFLSLIFLYIPTDFIDSTYESNKSFEKTYSDLSELSDFQSSIYLYVLGEHPEEMQSLYNKYVKIDDAASNIQKHINAVKKEQLHLRGFNSAGFPKDGHWEESTNKIMIGQGQADTILYQLAEYRTFVGELLDQQGKDSLYSILPLGDQLPVDGKNGMSEFTKFYFSHTPLNISILTLTHFQSELEQSKLLAYKNLFKNSVAAVKQEVESDSIAVEFYELLDWTYASSDSTISAAEETTHFRSEELLQLLQLTKDAEYTVVGPRSDLSETESQKDEEDLSDFERIPFVKILDPEKAIFFVNDPIAFEVYWNKADYPKAEMKVYNDATLIEKRIIRSPGRTSYLFTETGSYRFEFSGSGQIYEQRVQVIQKPKTQDETLLSHKSSDYFYAYPGMVVHLENTTGGMLTTAKYNIDITNADFSNQEGKNILHLREPGYAAIKVSEKEGDKKVLINKKFVVQKPHPFIGFGNYKDGEEVPLAVVSNLDALLLSQEEYFNNEILTVSTFEIQLAYNSNTVLSKTLTNEGAVFNKEVMHLLAQAQSGNSIIIKNIKAVSSLGAEITLNSIVLSIE